MLTLKFYYEPYLKMFDEYPDDMKHNFLILQIGHPLDD